MWQTQKLPIKEPYGEPPATINLAMGLSPRAMAGTKTIPGMTPKTTTTPSIRDRLLNKCWTVPIVGVVLVHSMLITVYLLAVVKGNIDPVLPFLSEAATFGPQAALFSQFLSFIGLIELITFLVRHEQIKHQTKGLIVFSNDRNRLLYINRLATGFGLVHGFVMPSVGIFRTTEYPFIHLFSALILIVTFNLHVLTNIYLTKCLHNFGLESRPITMSVNGFLHTFTNIMFGCSIVLFQAIENPKFGILTKEYSCLHNIPSILQWLSFCQMSVHMLCLSNRMRMFGRQIVQK